MGLLISERTGEYRPLSARTVVGRSPTCRLHIPDGLVSGEHASLSWRDGRWLVRDLGSRNGTWVDGKRLGAGYQHSGFDWLDTRARRNGSPPLPNGRIGPWGRVCRPV